MTIDIARQYLEANTRQILDDMLKSREAYSLVLMAKWGDDREVIAAVEKYMHYKLFSVDEAEQAQAGEALNPFKKQREQSA